MKTPEIYGIKNCDTVKKARRWLESNAIAYNFVDFRQDGLSAEKVETWLQTLPADQLINKRSTTWKSLDDDTKAQVLAGDIIDIVLANPTLIKRPVLENGDSIYVGFSEKNYSEIFNV